MTRTLNLISLDVVMNTLLCKTIPVLFRALLATLYGNQAENLKTQRHTDRDR